MRLLGYYIGHTFVNILRKLFKTWVAIFLVVCLAVGGLFGAVLGFLAGGLEGMIEESEPYSSESEAQESELPPGDPEGEVPAPGEEGPGSSLELPEGVSVSMLVEAGFGVLLLLWLLIATYRADKSIGSIFQPGDIMVMFTSPMKPQSVLMFRLVTAMGMSLVVTLYMLFQLPNLVLNLGLSLWTALLVIFAFGLFLMMTTLWKCFLYVFGSDHPRFRKMIQPGVYAVAVLAVGLVVLRIRSGRGILQALTDIFAHPVTRIIPLWGWSKSIPSLYMEENYLLMGGLLLACVAGMILFAVLIWNTPVDFYEDAMIKTEEMAELKRAAKEASAKGKMFMSPSVRKKDRSEKIARDGFQRGWGADVFFWKTLYNRKRFALGGFLTKTTVLYLVIALLMTVFLRTVVETDLFLPIPLVLMLVTFFRSLANPLQEDTAVELFRTAPPSHFSKLMYSALGAVAGAAMDVLPGLLLAAILMRANLMETVAWLLVIVTVYFYSISVGNFITLAAPSGAGKNIRQMFQVLFIYFGMIPDGLLIGIGIFLGIPALMTAAAAVINVGLGFLFLYLAKDFLANR